MLYLNSSDLINSHTLILITSIETSRGKLLLDLAGAKRMEMAESRGPSAVSDILTDTPKTRFDPQLMRSFLDNCKTNAELRKEGVKAFKQPYT